MLLVPGVRRRLYGASVVLPVGVVQLAGDAWGWRLSGMACLAATPLLIFDAIVRQVRTPMVVVIEPRQDPGAER